jgi:ribosomal protein S18 acetylase RimI-like enzyme
MTSSRAVGLRRTARWADRACAETARARDPDWQGTTPSRCALDQILAIIDGFVDSAKMRSEIRQAFPKDAGLLVDMMDEFHAESEFALNRDNALAAFGILLEDSTKGMAWIVTHDGAPAGYVVLTFRFSMEAGSFEACVDDLFVRRPFRCMGHGKALLTTALAECERRRVHAVQVEVASHNEAARKLYDRHGLKESGRLTLTCELAKNSLAEKA